MADKKEQKVNDVNVENRDSMTDEQQKHYNALWYNIVTKKGNEGENKYI